MNETQKAKITQFLDDKVKSDAVYQVLLNAFLKKGETDTQYLAASMLAVHKLEEAWKDLNRYRRDSELDNSRTNPGI